MTSNLRTFLSCGVLAVALASAPGASAETARENPDKAEWYLGAGGGLNFSSLHFSNLDKALYPENKGNFSGVFSFFAEVDFGKQRSFAIRPQLSFLTRGGRLTNIGSDYFENYGYEIDDPERLEDAMYRLKATYFDIRVPLIYQFGKAGWKIRPYAYVAPELGFVTNGYVAARFDYNYGVYEGVRYDLSKANMASAYFALGFGIGAKWQFYINDAPFFVGLELSYQLGLTDTYGSKEKKGTANAESFFPSSGKVTGSRKISAFEPMITFGVPLSVFNRRTPDPAPVVVEEPVYVEPAPAPVVEEKPCYSLDEIITMMNKGEAVAGKTICAIDDINFEFRESKIMASSYPYLDKLAEILKRTNAKICVKGHTDNIGTREFNLELSRKRALAVVKYLQKQGVSKNNLTYEYYGLSKPLTGNDTEEGRRMNRRVEFEIK